MIHPSRFEDYRDMVRSNNVFALYIILENINRWIKMKDGGIKI